MPSVQPWKEKKKSSLYISENVLYQVWPLRGLSALSLGSIFDRAEVSNFN